MRLVALILITILSKMTFADSDLSYISCSDEATGLKIEGPVTQSSREKWRYFAELSTSNGVKKTYEMRGFDGFDTDTRRNFVGYSYRSNRGKFIYTIESGAGRPAEVTLAIQLPELTGDNKDHELTCP